MELTLQNRIDYFSELITCSHPLYYWCYNPALELLSTSCPKASAYDTLFSIGGCKEYLEQYVKHSNKPLVLMESIGLVWIASFEASGEQITRIHMIGPAFISDVSVQLLEKKLAKTDFTLKLQRTFIDILSSLPILSINTYFQYGQMLHFTVTGEKISISSFHFQSSPDDTLPKETSSIKLNSSKESHGTWAAEQELVRMVEEGNLDYLDVYNKIAVTGSYGQLNLGSPFRHIQDYAITFIVIVSRAAMRAGLFPELAYTLSDYYFQSVETASSLTEIHEIVDSMYRDYITRVHDMKQSSHISRQIQESCNYIQIHSAEKLCIKDIAEQVGYAEYYFSKKFKKEMGISVKDYIQQTKIERAKIMLKSETANIQDISETLNFCSQSYFAETFHKFTGTTPNEYRTHYANK